LGRTVRHRTTDFQRTQSEIAQMRLALRSIEIRRSRIHGRGLFARHDIAAGSRLIQYVGRRIRKEQSDELCQKQNAYIFTLNDQDDLDGKVSWNPARLINHSCEPNCDAELDHRDRVWVISRRRILRGEELTWNYGYDLKDFMSYPCSCGSATCLGYMVAEEWFPAVRQMLSGGDAESSMQS